MTRKRLLAVSVPLLLLIAAMSAGFAFETLAPGALHPGKSVALVTRPIISDSPGSSLPPPITPVAPEHPVATVGSHIKIADLGIDLEIIQGDGVNAPLYKAAHYPTLPWPGEGGRSMIYAHARVGMFGPLWNAHVGEPVEVDTTDGHVLKYTIKEYYPRWPVTDLSILQNVNHEELVLLTCTSWNASDPRVVVIAEPAT